ncbi:YraN family protein [Helicobacter burdigaliensis]|uniref:YraN family protein n=1 Tax=Helicobacter burdigaliensis TaxID=2315334 RepID=UPI000EF6630C|nr:YraN family protein [Helicobacter burdigaliensis]
MKLTNLKNLLKKTKKDANNASKPTTQKGKEAEDFAIKFLEQQNFTIITRNYFSKFGEIDIIAKKDGILHFIEVKSGDGFEPIFNLTKTKLERIQKTIHCYLKSDTISYCIDGLILHKQEVGYKIDFYENLTMF